VTPPLPIKCRFSPYLSALALLLAAATRADEPRPVLEPTVHPALFLVGDSIMKTGTGNGDTGPWGWGSEIGALFDPAKIHVYNEGHGGRSSRSYIGEGLWAQVRDRLQPGDFVIIQFGHNDSANSAAYPDRATINASGDETVQVGVGDKKQVVHTYGWYLRQYAKDVRSKGAGLIICSPAPRDIWREGKIARGFDGYAQWAAEAARAEGAWFLDLNALAANRFDALGEREKTVYFVDGYQHTTKAGARLNAQSVAEGLTQLAGCPLAGDLAPGAAPAMSTAR
jgi:rhamnogalacturonan acetylesterase